MKSIPMISLLALVISSTFSSGNANSAPILPDFNAATFASGARIDNLYFPLLDGKTRIFVGQKEEDGEIVIERFELTNLGTGPTILGVQTTTRRDRSFEGGLLVEDTFDYFAQDTAGNVWYFGEDVTNYVYDDEGNLIGTNSASSWRAGENFANPSGDPAKPGFIMPAISDALTDGFNYFQEFAADDQALDQAEHFLPLVDISIGIGTFTNVLRVFETTELDPDAREFKYYAPGVGLVFVEEGLDPTLQNPEITFELVRAVPEPATLTLLGLGVLGVLASGQRKPPSGRHQQL